MPVKSKLWEGGQWDLKGNRLKTAVTSERIRTMTTSSDVALDIFYALKPAKYAFMESLSLKQSLDPAEWDGFAIVLQLASSAELESKRLYLQCSGVRDLRFGSFQGLMRYVVDIRSLRADQLEDRNYRIVESEHNLFSFTCRDFTANIRD